MQLGFENKKQTTWAIVLGVLAVIAVAYEFIPMSRDRPRRARMHRLRLRWQRLKRRLVWDRNQRRSRAWKILIRRLRLDLLALSEQTIYAGNNPKYFCVQAEEVVIPSPGSSGATDVKAGDPGYRPPSSIRAADTVDVLWLCEFSGEPKKIFLKQGEDVFVAGEGEIVNRRYKVIRISPTSVEIQDMVYSGPPQNIPLTQGMKRIQVSRFHVVSTVCCSQGSGH